jgi:WD40 repeat protein
MLCLFFLLYILIGCFIMFQVCNLAWCKNVNELVSTHGYSQNQIMVWKYPSMSKVQLPAPHISSDITYYKATHFLF